LKIYISQQCSDAVTEWWYISNRFITNLPQSVPVKKNVENRSTFGKEMDKTQKFAAYFFEPPCIYSVTLVHRPGGKYVVLFCFYLWNNTVIVSLLHWPPHVSGCILCWPFGQYSLVILLWLMFMLVCWLINSLN